MAKEDKFAGEVMSDEELDKVAGGNSYEMQQDSRFLNSLNGSCDRYGEFRIMFSAGAFNEEIEKAWASVGIKAEVSSGMGGFGKTNKYYRMEDGLQLSQEQARNYAMDRVGKHMQESDWNW